LPFAGSSRRTVLPRRRGTTRRTWRRGRSRDDLPVGALVVHAAVHRCRSTVSPCHGRSVVRGRGGPCRVLGPERPLNATEPPSPQAGPVPQPPSESGRQRRVASRLRRPASADDAPVSVPPARRPRTSSRTGRHPAPLGSASSGRPGSPSGQSVPQPTQLAFQLRGGGIHHPGVEAHARHHHEGVTTGPVDVDRPHSSADRRPQIGRDPKVTNKQEAGAPRQHRQRITAAGQRRRTHPRRADRRRQSPGRPLEPAPPWFGRSPGLAASSPASGFGGISASENLFHYCVKQPGLRHQRRRS
jgi:hypothetical protein